MLASLISSSSVNDRTVIGAVTEANRSAAFGTSTPRYSACRHQRPHCRITPAGTLSRMRSDRPG